MNGYVDYLADNLLTIFAVVVGILLLYWLLKKFFKAALLLIAVVLAFVGYHYFASSGGSFNERVKDAWQKTRTQSDRLMEEGRAVLTGYKKKVDKRYDEAVVQSEKEAKQRESQMKKKGEAIEDKLHIK